jgi:hypothetical protein
MTSCILVIFIDVSEEHVNFIFSVEATQSFDKHLLVYATSQLRMQ